MALYREDIAAVIGPSSDHLLCAAALLDLSDRENFIVLTLEFVIF